MSLSFADDCYFVKAIGVMNLPQMNKTVAILLTSLLSMVAITPQVEAAPPTPEIRSVELNLDAGTMIITGRLFGGLQQKAFRGNVRLHLAETGPITFKADLFENFVATEAVPARLQRLTVNGLPQNLADFEGVHLLEVRRRYNELVDGVSVAKFVIGTSLVTIGSEGPEGPKGDTGDAGQDGADGAQGPKGDAGTNGTDGTNGTNGKDGAQGPAGVNGSDGVGVSQTTIDADGNLIVTLTNGSEINAGQVKDTSVVLELSKQSELFDYTGGTRSLNIQSNTNWRWVNSDKEAGVENEFIWLTAPSEEASQSGNQTFTYEVDELRSSAPREVTLNFVSDNGPIYSLYFTVRQEPASWQQLGTDIDGEDAYDLSGWCVSLSADGNIVAIGAPNNGGSELDAGHVRIFQYDGSIWQQLGADIDGEAAADTFGRSVSLSSDGSIVAIGADGSDGNGGDSGHVSIYQYDGVGWQQLGADIDGEASDDYSGSSVSLSADGSVVAIGAPRNDGNGDDSGHVRIYQYDGSSWQQLGADIDGEASGDLSGSSVSLSADGSIVAIGAHDGGTSYSGYVSIYQYDDSSWRQLGANIDGEAEVDQSGWSVSISRDGTMVAIGAPNNEGDESAGSRAGHVRIYRYDGNSWYQLGADIDGEALSNSGWSVCLSADGNAVAIGAPANGGNEDGATRVRIYELTQAP